MQSGNFSLFAVVAFVFGCGARSSLDVDRSTEAVVPVCAPRSTAESSAVEIVFDASGSMLDDGKLEAALFAVRTVLGELNAEASERPEVGLMIFEDRLAVPCDRAPCKYPSPSDVSPGLVDDKQLQRLLKRMEGTTPRPFAGTPTSSALAGAYALLEHGSASRKFVILVSDGLPNDDPTLAIERARDAAKAGVRTFALGVAGRQERQGGYDPKFMAELSLAGKTARLASCNPSDEVDMRGCFYEASSLDPEVLRMDVLSGLRGIFEQVARCE